MRLLSRKTKPLPHQLRNRWRVDITNETTGEKQPPLNLMDGDVLAINMPPDDAPLVGLEAILRKERDDARHQAARLRRTIWEQMSEPIWKLILRRLRAAR